MKHARPDYDCIQVHSHVNPPPVNIPGDEPVFLLRGQDILAEMTVRFWAFLAHNNGVDPKLVQMAVDQAERMQAWPKHKVPDLPSHLATQQAGQAAQEATEDVASRAERFLRSRGFECVAEGICTDGDRGALFFLGQAALESAYATLKQAGFPVKAAIITTNPLVPKERAPGHIEFKRPSNGTPGPAPGPSRDIAEQACEHATANYPDARVKVGTSMFGKQNSDLCLYVRGEAPTRMVANGLCEAGFPVKSIAMQGNPFDTSGQWTGRIEFERKTPKAEH